ncbi:hypothetical protein MCEMAEM6B_01371 [Mycobacteriaceae bacterium]
MTLVAVLVLFTVLVAAGVRAPTDSRGSSPIFSAYVIVVIGFALYTALPALLTLAVGDYTWAPQYYSEEAFSHAVWTCVFALIIFLYAYNIAQSRIWTKDPDDKSRPLLNDRFKSTAQDPIVVVFLALGILIKLYLITKAGGLDSLVRLSGFGRKFSGQEAISTADIRLFTISGIADGAATWGLLGAFKSRNRQNLWLAVFFATLLLSYFILGKRLVLLLPLICAGVGFHVYRRALTTRLLPIALTASIVLGFGSILARVFLPAIIGGYSIDYSKTAYAEGSLVKLYLYSGEYSSLEMISVVLESRRELVDLFGGTWKTLVSTNLDPFLYTIPRALWPSKPDRVHDFGYALSSTLGATSFDDPTVGYASTVIGTSLAAGFLGLIIAMLALGVCAAAIDASLRHRAWSELRVVLFSLGIVFVFYLVRQGSPGWAFIISVVQNYGVIGSLLILAYRAKGKASSAKSDTSAMSRRLPARNGKGTDRPTVDDSYRRAANDS